MADTTNKNTTNIDNVGAQSYGELVADNQGNLYGTTIGKTDGDTPNVGTVFKMTSDGKGGFSPAQNIATFDGSDGNAFPTSKLYVDNAGNVFGTTIGDSNLDSKGTVFKLTPNTDGSYKTNVVHKFDGDEGFAPNGGVIGDGKGNLYGTTTQGGEFGKGEVFKLSPNGDGTYAHSSYYSFNGINGSSPEGELTLDPKTGTLYGTTSGGGDYGKGTVFKLVPTANGVQDSHVSFGPNAADGAAPNGGLALDSSGNLYGTTYNGGTNGTGTVFRVPADFSSAPQTVKSFDAEGSGNATGAHPNSSTLIDPNTGSIYSTTTQGGAKGTGTVFEVPKGGEFKTLSSVNGSQDSAVSGGLYADKFGNILGLTANGSVFKIAQSESGYTPTAPSPTPPCYCTGTRILTDRGEVAVEDLAIGDVVVTASGEHRAIKWIGNRGYTGRFANTNPAVLPVCVKAGALADAVPARDLWVSPDHALFLDGVLIPAERLINGVTVVKAERVETVTYWHVELDSHDVLLAEGAAAESFVDDGGRAIFHNAASFRTLYPSQPARIGAAAYCAPRVEDGYALEAVRRRLAQRAGLPVAPARVFGELVGHLDRCDGTRVSGWAQDRAYPDAPVCLDIVVDGTVVALAYAEAYRADLAAAGIGDGRHAFDLDLPQPLDADVAHVVSVRRSADGVELGTLRVEPTVRIVRAA